MSDSIGGTAESVIKATVSQFTETQFDVIRIPYVNNREQIDRTLEEAAENHAVVCYTIVSAELRKHLADRALELNLQVVDVLGPMLKAIEKNSGLIPKNQAGLIHALDHEYFKRVEAIEFAVKYDDGKNPLGLLKADIVIIGVSRTSKTPYSQIELRILANLCGDTAMQEAFLHGADIHTATAAQVFDLPPEMVTDSMRSAAKAVNFGIIYGIGAFSLSKDIHVSVAQADQYIKNYLARYPRVAIFMEETVEHAKELGYVSTYFKRRRPVPELRQSNKMIQASGKRIAMNTPIQGTAADIIKIAMIHVSNRLQEECPAAKLILQVHDELIVEVPEQQADLAAQILKEEMEHVVQFAVPLTVEVKKGKSWYDAKG